MKKTRTGIFITGTDTGVGKTHIAAAIVKNLGKQGVDCGVMKPAETGCRRRNGRLVPADAIRLMKAAGTRDAVSLVNPYRFSQPVAPSVAAQICRKHIDPAKIRYAYNLLSCRHHFMVVEGAGGIMVPLAEHYSFLDLAADMGLPAVIVARPGLGTINHSLLTINALKHCGVPIAGVVINAAESARSDLAETTNPSVIAELSGIRILGIVAHGSSSVEGIVEALLSP